MGWHSSSWAAATGTHGAARVANFWAQACCGSSEFVFTPDGGVTNWNHGLSRQNDRLQTAPLTAEIVSIAASSKKS
jgi:hypothetical protein